MGVLNKLKGNRKAQIKMSKIPNIVTTDFKYKFLEFTNRFGLHASYKRQAKLRKSYSKQKLFKTPGSGFPSICTDLTWQNGPDFFPLKKKTVKITK